MSTEAAKRVVFKCAFGGNNGWGHVIRCSALAGEFRRRGWETILWGEGESGSLPEDVASSFSRFDGKGQELASILIIDEMYTEQAELEALATAWKTTHPDGVVAGVDDMQRRSMRGFDLVLNTEIGLREAAYEASTVLLGERYALLRMGFGEASDPVAFTLPSDLVPVLVMMGGTDPFGYLPKVLTGLSRFSAAKFAPVVVAGESGGLEGCLEPFIWSRMLKRVGASELASWMEICRFGIVACGTSLYESAAMRLPFVGVSLVDNQTATARKVKELWGMPILHCESERRGELDLEESLRKVMGKEKDAYSEVDTNGAARVFEALKVLL